MRAAAVGLLVEEQRGEIAAAWRRAADEELGGELAIGYAVPPLLREMGRSLRSDASPPGAHDERLLRSAILVRSGASPARIAREFKLLHRAVWDVLRAAGRIVPADERRAVDEWLDDALAAALDRVDRVRMRIDLLDHGAATVQRSRTPAASQRPPPLPRSMPRSVPPPLPSPEIIGPIE